MLLAEGAVIGGRYRLSSLIGEGGMASVWRAEDLTLKRAVAIKVLFVRSQQHAQSAADQFLREARIAASVQHRNVIHTVDFGVTDDHMPFMVMELLHGESLGERMARRPPLRLDEVLQIASLTLRGLAAVHDAGIVHRDLKPDNIFLQRDADVNFPKILDFGISRSLGATARSAIATQQGLIVGTPEYMAPEQARGETDIDKRADIYAIGAIIYEGITGRMPFEAGALPELIVKIAAGRPVPIRERRPDLPDALVECVEQAMAADRNARFADAAAFRRALTHAAERALTKSPNLFSSESPVEHVAFDEAPLTQLDVAAAVPQPIAAAGGAAPGPAWGGFAELEGRGPRAAKTATAAQPGAVASAAAHSSSAGSSAVRGSSAANPAARASSAANPAVRGSSAANPAVRAPAARVATPGAHTDALQVSHDEAMFGDNPLDTFAGDAGRLELDMSGPNLPRVMGVAGVAANQTSHRDAPIASAVSRVVPSSSKPSAAFWVLPALLLVGLLTLLFVPSVFSPAPADADAAIRRETENPATRDGTPFRETSARPKLGAIAPALRDITF